METSMLDYLQMFFRRKHLFIFPFIITFMIVVALSYVLPKSYQSKAVILIEEEEVINPLIKGLAVSTSVAERAKMIEEQILGWNSLIELIKRLEMDKDVKSPSAFESLIKTLRKNVIVQLKGPQVAIIAYQGTDPVQTQQVVKTLTDIFIQQNVESQTKETDVAVSFLKKQLGLYRRKIKEDEIERLQQDLDHLLMDSTDKHPMVRQLRERITKLTTDLDTDTIDIPFTMEKEVSEKDLLSMLLYKELKKDEVDPATGEKKVADDKPVFATAGPKVTDLPMDAKVNQDIYAMLLHRLETARITKELETFKEGTRFSIIEPARVPLKPSQPDKIMFLLMGIAAGIGVGIGAIFLAEMIDHSYKNLNDAKVDLGLPVLGVISAIVTEDEFKSRKGHTKFVYLLIGILFLLTVIFVISTVMFV